MRVAIYARVSTDDKDQDPERQFLKCRQYCELHGHVVVGEFKEYHTGDSGPLKRPESSKMFDLDIDGVVVFSMDRLTREHPVKVIQLINMMKDRGIKLVSITEPAFNMESEFSEIMLFLMGWFNNYFLIKLKRDTRAGIERARKEGKQIGRARVKFNHFRAYELLFVKKLSQRVVSKELGVSLATLNRFKKGIDKNPVLFIKGSVVSNTNVLGTQGGV